MMTITQPLTEEEIVLIAGKDDFHIAPLHPDGETYGTPTWIWNVEVDHKLYVRAYNCVNSRWYQAAMQQKAGIIEAAGLVRKVRYEAISGELLERIDRAYQAKYSDSPYLGAMISEKARAATVRVY